jgi:HAE1 family hydrophobic/amphiphilic exporter-1
MTTNWRKLFTASLAALLLAAVCLLSVPGHPQENPHDAQISDWQIRSEIKPQLAYLPTRSWVVMANLAELRELRILPLIARQQPQQATATPTPTPTPKPTPLPAPRPQQQSDLLNITARPIPTRTVGLESGKVTRWTLKDAILAALENNPDIEIERSRVRQSQFDLFAAEGAYDPISTQGTSYVSTRQPNTRPFSGTTESTLNSQRLTYNFGYQGFVQRTGGFYTVDFNNQRTALNFGLFDTQYDPTLNLRFTQPILRNFKIDPNRRQILIAKRNLDLSDAQFRLRAIQIISQVQQAYWDLAFAIKNEEIQRDAVKLAETQLTNNKRQVEVGTLAPIDIVSAATEFESRRQQVFQAMNTVAQAENSLKALTVSSPGDELWSALIIPVESFEVQTNTLPLGDALRLAMDNRPELKQFALRKEINKTDIDFFRNQTKPQVDFFVGYNTFGVGGSPGFRTQDVGNCSSTFPTVNGPVCLSAFTPVLNAQGQITGYQLGILQTPFTTSSRSVPTAASEFVGGYGTGLKNLFKNDFRQWQVGVNITLNWRNRTAKANLGRALEENRRIDLDTRRQMQAIEVEVRNAVQSVETAKMRIEASRAARQYAEQQLEGENKKFQAGLSTTFFVLTRQTDLARARGEELRALADFNKAVADLQRVIATTLTSNSIEVRPAAPATLQNSR